MFTERNSIEYFVIQELTGVELPSTATERFFQILQANPNGLIEYSGVNCTHFHIYSYMRSL